MPLPASPSLSCNIGLTTFFLISLKILFWGKARNRIGNLTYIRRNKAVIQSLRLLQEILQRKRSTSMFVVCYNLFFYPYSILIQVEFTNPAYWNPHTGAVIMVVKTLNTSIQGRYSRCLLALWDPTCYPSALVIQPLTRELFIPTHNWRGLCRGLLGLIPHCVGILCHTISG